MNCSCQYESCDESFSIDDFPSSQDAYIDDGSSDILYLHMFRFNDEKRERYQCNYYVSFEKWYVGDQLIKLNIRCKRAKTNFESFVLIHKQSEEIYDNFVYRESDYQTVVRSIHNIDDYDIYQVGVYLANANFETLSRPLRIHEEEDCVICMEPIAEPLFTCGHFAHVECISKCRPTNKMYCCPVCRAEARLPNIYYFHEELRESANILFEAWGKAKSRDIALAACGKRKKTQEQIISHFMAKKGIYH